MNTRLIRLCICTMAAPTDARGVWWRICEGEHVGIDGDFHACSERWRGQRQSAFTTCLKQHGVTLPAGFGGGRGGPGAAGPGGGSSAGRVGRSRAVSRRAGGGAPAATGLSSAQQSAFSACRSKLPAGGFGGGRGFAGGAQRVPAQGVHVVFERPRREGPDHDLDAGCGRFRASLRQPARGVAQRSAASPRRARRARRCCPVAGQGAGDRRRLIDRSPFAAGSRPNRQR